MTWLRIDDGMVDHRKWAALEDDPRVWSECLAVWVALASYCQRTLSDGHVPDSRLARLTPLGARAKARCDDMVRVGLMERVGDGYVFHDWLVYQASRRQVEEQREQKTQRQARWRKGSGGGGGSTGAPPTATVDAHVDASTSRLVDAPRDAPVEPAPSHPIPSHPIQRSTSASDAGAREGAVEVPSSADPTETALRRGYQTRYQREARDAWMTHVSDDPWIKRAALWCRQQPRPLEAAERFLDGAFGEGAPASWRKNRHPWKWLGEDPGRTASFSTLPTGAMGEHETMGAARAAAMAAIPTMDLTSMEGETW